MSTAENIALDAQMLKRETGAGILGRVEDYLQRFVAYPSEHTRVAHTLWIAHTHLMDCWESTPRISFLSAERGSGKTRALEITEPLVPSPVHAVNVTPAYLFRKVGEEGERPTILFDEVDTLFHSKVQDTGEIRGLLNAGHRRGAVAGRCVTIGKRIETEEIPAYCAVALAGIGNLPDTIASRSIIIEMRRRAPDEPVEPFRRKLHEPQGTNICRALKGWCEDIASSVEDAQPVMPTGVDDRDADCWEALLAIADVAGGDWPQRARAAAVALVAGGAEKTMTTGVQLLSDMYDVWDEENKWPTETILRRLHNLPESPWADIRGKALDSRGLATRLRKYGIKPKVLRLHDGTQRGYDAADLQDAWKRYVLPSREEAKQAKQAKHGPESVTEKVSENCEKLPPVSDVTDVTHFPGMQADVTDKADFEERAAILEYDAGLTREQAETQAQIELEIPDFLRRDKRSA
jgi:hypothetical protein